MEFANILTGGICCGKSTIASLLSMHGYFIIDADKIAHKALEDKVDSIRKAFGDSVIDSNGVNRAALGKMVFLDSKKKELLESILHPLIYERIMEACKIEEKKGKPYFIDLPLYFESKHAYKARFVICAYAPRKVQIERLIKRNNLGCDDARLRVDSQIDIEIKRAKSDYVIENIGSLRDLQESVEGFLRWLESRFG